jgi:hypothetical protein
MDKGGIATSLLSPTAPQVVPIGKPVAIKIARDSNEYSKKMMADHPGRFGIFATLPLPHVDESLKEISYAFDTLNVDGIGMMTNYGDKWLGHPFLDPIWQELHIIRVSPAAEAAHGGRGRVRVGCRDQHVLGPNSGRSLGQFLGLIQKVAWHHACVHNRNRDLVCAIVQNDTSPMEQVLHAISGALREHGIDKDRKFLRGNIDGVSACAKDPVGLSRRGGRAQDRARRREDDHQYG